MRGLKSFIAGQRGLLVLRSSGHDHALFSGNFMVVSLFSSLFAVTMGLSRRRFGNIGLRFAPCANSG
jgi:hypothetical protein